MGKMIAQGIKGAEFFYNRTTAHWVPKTSAEAICKALNDARYKLEEGRIWQVYDCFEYELNYTEAGCQSFRRRNGRIVEVREYH